MPGQGTSICVQLWNWSHGLHLFIVYRTVITQDQFLKRHDLPPDQQTKLERGVLLQEAATNLCDVSKPDILVKIMTTFDMLTPCELDMNGEKVPVYLVPCLMQRVPEDKLEARGDEVPMMHFKFAPSKYKDSTELDTMGFLPHGLFHRLTSRCCQKKEWSHFEKLMFYDYMVLGVQDFYFSLHMVHNGITLSAFNFDGEAVNHSLKLSEIRSKIQSVIEQITSKLFPNLVCVPFLLCACDKNR